MSKQSTRLKAAGKAILPAGVRTWLRTQQQRFSVKPPVGSLRFGSLNRVTPISSVFGFDRGHCIDRYYIEDFLKHHAADIKGHVLEVADNEYTLRFGKENVEQSSVLHAVDGNPKATIVANLTAADNIPSNTFDCMIITQTLQFIYDVAPAISSIYRILKPQGVVLATIPGISQISLYDMERWGDFWRFTSASARRLFEEAFLPNDVDVRTYGNVFAAMAFLHGLATEDVEISKLDSHDPAYEVVVTVRAVKSATP
jgi:SAM-dependent methyltransferase